MPLNAIRRFIKAKIWFVKSEKMEVTTNQIFASEIKILVLSAI